MTDTPRTIEISPVTRVEGHGKVTIHLDQNGMVDEARLHIVEFRGFERFIHGRLLWEVPVIVQRLCGICPVSHHLAAAKAMDVICGVDELPPTAEKMRRLMHYGQVMQSHGISKFFIGIMGCMNGCVCKKSLAGKNGSPHQAYEKSNGIDKNLFQMIEWIGLLATTQDKS